MAESFDVMGRLLGYTVAIATTNASTKLTALLEAALDDIPNWVRVKGVTITCENNDARIAFGVDAANGGTPVGHVLGKDTSLRLPSSSLIREARVISGTSGSAATLMVTLEQ